MADRGRDAGAAPAHRSAQQPTASAAAAGTGGTGRPPEPEISQPFARHIVQPDASFIVDEILPPGTLLEAVSVDVLNGYINYVEPKAVITERDPDEEERYISISNQFYTHFHEFGTVIHVIGATDRHLWYFCYDIDASYCMLGRVSRESVTIGALIAWVYHERVSRRYPVLEIDPKNLHGWRSFQ